MSPFYFNTDSFNVFMYSNRAGFGDEKTKMSCHSFKGNDNLIPPSNFKYFCHVNMYPRSLTVRFSLASMDKDFSYITSVTLKQSGDRCRFTECGGSTGRETVIVSKIISVPPHVGIV